MKSTSYFLRNAPLLIVAALVVFLQTAAAQKIRPIAMGWANNTVNTVVFRKNSLVSFGDTQYVAYYDTASYMVLGKRKIGTDIWFLQRTAFKGNTLDAHNSISIMVDGDGYLHVSWDHHANPLRYSKSIAPGSLSLTDKLPMTGIAETNVTYPEFYKLPNGNLLFLYRDGRSGQGNLVLNQYDITTKQWKQLHHNLIDGQKKRNAYWQACVDAKGQVHLSWVWRETSDVSSNHDMCYAMSADGGTTWRQSNGSLYQLPITAASAEYVAMIPEKSELINQTSMYAGPDGIPIIASYWRDANDSIPQYHIITPIHGKWTTQNLGFRATPFSLSGTGSKRIPISRPQIVSWVHGGIRRAALIFRDEERGSKVSVAVNGNLRFNKWKIKDARAMSVGSWEPTYDTELWRQHQKMHLFMQYTEQVDGEGKANIAPQMVQVLEWKF